jgi:hypothetical protein
MCKECRNKERLLRARANGVKARGHEQDDAVKNGFIICKKCGRSKPLTEYEKRADTGNYRLTCIECRSGYLKDYYGKMRDDESFVRKRKQYYEDHIDEVKARSKKHYEENKEHLRELGKKWQEEHLDEVKAYKKQYRLDNKERIREVVRAYWARPENRERKRLKNREYQSREDVKLHRKEYQRAHMRRILERRNERMSSDPLYKMQIRIGKLVGVSLRQRGYSKQTRTYKLIGLQYDDLWEYLKTTWLENYGTEYNDEPYEIDHVHPLSDAKTESELLELWNYRNLQLLTPEDNGDKLDKLDWTPPKTSGAYGRIAIKNGNRILLIDK